MRSWVVVLAIAFLPGTSWAVGPDEVPLWPNGAPGAAGTEAVDQPGIRVYPPSADKNTGTAVVICPGGGYGVLAYDHEGHQLAEWYRERGVTGVVLKYRLAPRYRHPAPLQDVQRALRLVRSMAADLKVDSNRVGVMGFSAGGHLASTVSTHYDLGQADSPDPTDRLSCRPSFTVLGYPVISLSATYSHKGSGKNLFGEDAKPEQLEELSNDLHVTKDTPPAFLFHTGEDRGVPAENSLAYYAALLKHGVPAELHVYQWGPHGVGMAPGEPAVETWTDQLHGWLRTSGFLSDKKRTHVKGTVTYQGKPLRWGSIAFVPEGDENAPVGWAMISNGKYDIPLVRGVVVGVSKVAIRDLGAVEPRPTIEDFKEISPPGALTIDAQPGENAFDFDLK